MVGWLILFESYICVVSGRKMFPHASVALNICPCSGTLMKMSEPFPPNKGTEIKSYMHFGRTDSPLGLLMHWVTKPWWRNGTGIVIVISQMRKGTEKVEETCPKSRDKAEAEREQPLRAANSQSLSVLGVQRRLRPEEDSV